MILGVGLIASGCLIGGRQLWIEERTKHYSEVFDHVLSALLTHKLSWYLNNVDTAAADGSVASC